MNRDEMFKLIKSINSQNAGKPLSDDKLGKSFDKWWSEFDEKISKIKRDYKPAKPVRDRPQVDIIDEILEIVRSLQKSSQQMFPTMYQPINLPKEPATHDVMLKAFIDAGERREIIKKLKSWGSSMPDKKLNTLTLELLQHLFEPLIR